MVEPDNLSLNEQEQGPIALHITCILWSKNPSKLPNPEEKIAMNEHRIWANEILLRMKSSLKPPTFTPDTVAQSF